MQRGEKGRLRHGIRLALLGVLLIVFLAMASLALGLGDAPESRLGLAVGVTMCPMGLLVWWLCRPTTAFWPIVLRFFACAVLAVSSFWLWRLAESPLGACVVGVGYAMLAFLQIGLGIALARLRDMSNTAGAPGKPAMRVGG